MQSWVYGAHASRRLRRASLTRSDEPLLGVLVNSSTVVLAVGSGRPTL